jgi:large subunit ribosomal protein L24
MKTKQKRHVKIGDQVLVISGKQKNTLGNIVSINTKKSIAFIDTILPRIKYVKNREGGESQKLEIQIPIHISNIMLWDKQANMKSRIGYKLDGTVKKRYFKKSGNFI